VAPDDPGPAPQRRAEIGGAGAAQPAIAGTSTCVFTGDSSVRHAPAHPAG
jgi:hypothetical protein